MSDLDDEWDCDFISGAAKVAATQRDTYKAKNRKTKKETLSKKSLDDSSVTVSPLKRRQSTEPLKQNTSQNVISPTVSPNKASKNATSFKTSDDVIGPDSTQDEQTPTQGAPEPSNSALKSNQTSS